LLAAALHAGWNYRLKQCQQRLPVLWWALAWSALGVLPCLIWVPLPAGEVRYAVAASALVQALYLALLSHAYSLADFSWVYPLARGAAPLFLLFWSRIYLHETLQPLGLVGVAVLSLGLLGMGIDGKLRLGRAGLPALLAALGVALLISLYTAIDGWAVKHSPALPYFVAQISLSVGLALPLLFFLYGPTRLWMTLKQERKAIAWVGLGSGLAYLLALQAYSLSPVGYAGAVREISVVFAAWLGLRASGESAGRIRLLSCLLIFVGIALIAAA